MADSTWLEMMKRLPTAFDTAEARAQRANEVLGQLPAHVPAPIPNDGMIESSLTPRQLQAQAAFDAHMAEIARLQKLQQASEPAPPPIAPPEDFDPSSYTTYKRP